MFSSDFPHEVNNDYCKAEIREIIDNDRLTDDDKHGVLHRNAEEFYGLAGAYNDVGVRRWFHRPRKLLNGNTPAHLLDGDWGPDDDGPRQVRGLVS